MLFLKELFVRFESIFRLNLRDGLAMGGNVAFNSSRSACKQEDSKLLFLAGAGAADEGREEEHEKLAQLDRE